MEDFIEKYLYRDDLGEDDPFMFGVTLDSEGKPHLDDGSSPEKALHVGITTKRLLREGVALDDALYHIDGTYKLVINGFPFIVFARSDLR